MKNFLKNRNNWGVLSLIIPFISLLLFSLLNSISAPLMSSIRLYKESSAEVQIIGTSMMAVMFLQIIGLILGFGSSKEARAISIFGVSIGLIFLLYSLFFLFVFLDGPGAPW